MPVTCTEILNDGAGPPGRSVELEGIIGSKPGSRYAERAVKHFDDETIELPGWEIVPSDFDGESRVIEVRGLPGGPERFRVTCRVVRDYTAERLETQS